MKNICVVNTSYQANSKTMFLTNSFVEGLLNFNKSIKINFLNLSNLDIKFCSGCGKCWFDTQNICKYNDDFTKNIETISKSELIIFSCPIWVGSGNHLFRIFTERFIALTKPDFEYNGDKVGHKKKHNVILDSILLISTCALPEKHNFEPLIKHLESLEYLADMKLKGAVLKAQSLEMLYYSDEEKEELKKKCIKLGEYYAQNLELSQKLLDEIYKPKLPIDEYLNLVKTRQNYIRTKFY